MHEDTSLHSLGDSWEGVFWNQFSGKEFSGKEFSGKEFLGKVLRPWMRAILAVVPQVYAGLYDIDVISSFLKALYFVSDAYWEMSLFRMQYVITLAQFRHDTRQSSSIRA